MVDGEELSFEEFRAARMGYIDTRIFSSTSLSYILATVQDDDMELTAVLPTKVVEPAKPTKAEVPKPQVVEAPKGS